MKVYQLTKTKNVWSYWPGEVIGLEFYESKADALAVSKAKNKKAVSNFYAVRPVNVKPAKAKP